MKLRQAKKIWLHPYTYRKVEGIPNYVIKMGVIDRRGNQLKRAKQRLGLFKHKKLVKPLMYWPIGWPEY